MIVSFFTGGAAVGSIIAGYVSDYLGRRGTIAFATLIFCIGAAMQCAGPNKETIMAGRWIGGMGVGNLCMIIPLYQAELAHPTIRGRVTALQQFFLGIGALAASWIGYGCFVGFTDNRQWRVPLGVQIAPAFVLGCLIFFFPESPRWLMSKGKMEQGLHTIAKLHAHGDIDNNFVRVEFDSIAEDIEAERETTASWTELFTERSSFRRIVMMCAIQASIQMTGVSAIQYYSPTIFAQMGISTVRTLLYQAINSIIALIAQFFCILTIDYTGRRWTLITGNIGNCITFIVGAILLAVFPPTRDNNPRSAQIGFIATTWIYNFCFSWACGPLSWIIPAEVFNIRTRSKGIALATFFSFAFNTMIGQVTPIAMANIQWRYYILFIVCNATNALFFWAFLPETNKTPLEYMDKLWQDAPLFIPAWQRKDYFHELEEKAAHIDEKTAAPVVVEEA
jgi:sugar porter (SP) family MFS transporter